MCGCNTYSTLWENSTNHREVDWAVAWQKHCNSISCDLQIVNVNLLKRWVFKISETIIATEQGEIEVRPHRV